MAAAQIGSFGKALPPAMQQADLWNGYFDQYYGGSRVAARLFRTVGVQTRHGAVNPSFEDISEWGTAARMQRFAVEALPLGKEALSTALSAQGLDAEDLGMLVVASCTGYGTPGLNVTLARDLGMSAELRSLMIGHMGCYAAIPALGAAADYVNVHQRPAAVLCLELTSLHVQPSQPIPRPLTAEAAQQMVVHALFSDAAAAAVITPERSAGALEVVEIAALTDTSTTDMMSWDVTDLGFRMGLSREVPRVLGRHVRPATEQLLARHGLTLGDVRGWVVHPGGPEILETVGAALDLTPQQLQPSRDILRDYGNCSSATVPLILEHVQNGMTDSGHLVALAFGPGLTLYAALLRAI